MVLYSYSEKENTLLFLCVHVPVCVYMNMYVPVHVKVRGQLRCLFIALYLILKTGFFTELKLTNSASLGGQ